MAELDGLWEVRRVSGLLPPMRAWVEKRIAGERGETVLLNGPGLPFDVSGVELRYRRPLNWLVDVLERSGDGYDGRAVAFGRTIGTFRLERKDLRGAATPR